MKLRSSFQRLCSIIALSLVSVLLTACGGFTDFSADLPPRPSPFPTLPRLPSVTPVTPSPTPPATATVVPTATPTPVPLQASVATTANMRSGPSLDASVVTIVEAGQILNLRARRDEWYAVELPGGLSGWMFSTVLTIDPTIAAAVPEDVP